MKLRYEYLYYFLSSVFEDPWIISSLSLSVLLLSFFFSFFLLKICISKIFESDMGFRIKYLIFQICILRIRIKFELIQIRIQSDPIH